MKRFLLFIALFAGLNFAVSAQTIFYVNVNVSGGTNDGSSWANAFSSLDDALNQAISGDEIWVASGTYYLGSPADFGNPNYKEKTFIMAEGVNVYGGFAGNETLLNQRNWLVNETSLNAWAGTGDQTNNYYHVAVIAGLNSGRLDGFIIEEGVAEGANTMIINGETIDNEKGGGIYCVNSSNYTLANLTVRGCIASYAGGVYFEQSPLTFQNSTVKLCFANTGGGIVCEQSPVKLVNLLVCENASNEAGGIHFNMSNASIINSTVANNEVAINGGGMLVTDVTTKINVYNCIIAGNVSGDTDGVDIYSESVGISSYQSSLIQNPNLWSENLTAQNGLILEQDPLLKADYTLEPFSPAVDAGNNSLYNTATYGNFDLSGNKRILDAGIDMGANELSVPTALFNNGDVSTCGASGADLKIEIGDQGIAPFFVSYDIYQDGNYIGSDSWTGLTSGLNTIRVQPTVNTTYNLTFIFDSQSDKGNAVGSVTVSVNSELKPDANGILYVNNSALSSGDGSNWDNAVKELADALLYIQTCGRGSVSEIWVAQGTYYPLHVPVNTVYNKTTKQLLGAIDSRDMAFELPDNVKIYGGFAGYENNLSQRNWVNSETILSGDLEFIGDNSDNAYHVIIAHNLTSARLDGFVIMDGNADGLGWGYINRDLRFYQNDGGGIYDSENQENVIFANLKITQNSAINGGGVYSISSMARYANTLITSNYSYSIGGGVLFDGSTASLVNNTVVDNYTGVDGSQIGAIAGSSPKIYNTIVWDNMFQGFEVLHLNSSSPQVEASMVQNYTGFGDPMFFDPYGGDYHVQPNSAAINRGQLFFYDQVAFGDFDLDNNYRIEDGMIDIGVYETKCKPPFAHLLTTDNTTICAGSTVNFTVTIDDPFFTPPYELQYTVDDGSSVNIEVAFIDNNPFTLSVMPTKTSIYTLLSIRNGTGCMNYDSNMSEPITVNVLNSTPDVNGVLYVDKSIATSGDGSSWTTPLKELSDALKYAQSCGAGTVKEIRVAQGTYIPLYKIAEKDNQNQSTLERDRTFFVPAGIKLYGSYKGGAGADANDRDTLAYKTILTGDLDNNDIEGDFDSNKEDNAYHVLVAGTSDDSIIIDGFSITGSNGDDYNGISLDGFSVYRDHGGGVFIDVQNSANVTLTNNNIYGNKTTYLAGGIYVAMVKPNASVTILNNNIYNNRSNLIGGGVYIESIENPLYTITYDSQGGSYVPASQYYAAQEVTVEEAPTKGGYIFEGWNTTPDGSGTLYMPGEHFFMYNYDFTLYAIFSPDFGRSTSQKATSTKIALTEDKQPKVILKATSAALNVHNNNFLNNVSDLGGALYIKDTELNLYGNKILNNLATSQGGGIYIEAANSENIIIEKNIISGNDSYQGAGIYTSVGANVNISIVNNEISKNTAVDNGGGIYANTFSASSNTNLTFTNNTITANKADENGGGAFLYAGAAASVRVVFNNNLIWGNTASVDNNIGGQLSGGNRVIFNNCLVEEKSHVDLTTFPYDGSGDANLEGRSAANLEATAAKLFQNFAGNNYRLKAGSIAVNVGENSYISSTGVIVDIDSLNRIFANTVDLGAYEYLWGGLLLANDTVVYNGNERTFGNELVGMGELNGIATNTPSIAKGTNVGSYPSTELVSMIDVVKLYPDTTLTAYLVILPAEFTGITFTDSTAIYDGAAKSINVNNLPSGATVAYTGNAQTDVGTYIVTAVVSMANYKDSTLTATLTIEPGSLTGMTFNDDIVVYDGTPKSIFVENIPSGAIVNYTGNAQTDVGTYMITAVVSKPNYNDTTLVATLIIEPATLTGIIFNDLLITYDGAAHSIFVDNLPLGATVNYVGNGEINVGKYVVTATVSKPNYKDTTLMATIEIEPAVFNGLLFNDKIVLYDETAHSIFVDNLPLGAIVNYTGNGQINVGNYMIEASISKANYRDTTMLATLTIEPALITDVIFDDLKVLYDGLAHSIFASNLPADATVNYTGNAQINTGTYTVEAVVSKANYKDLLLTATLTIDPDVLTGMFFDDDVVTYDGQAHSIFVTNLPDGATVNYIDNNQINPGVYTVEAIISKANYKDTSMFATLTIEPGVLSGMVFNNSTVTYDGTAHSIFVGNLPSGATVSYAGNSKTDIGTYTVEAIISKTHYKDTTMFATLTIEPAVLTGLVFDDKTVVYDGSAHSIFVTNLPADATVSYVDNNQVDAGVYTVEATVSSPNHKDIVLTANLTIEPAVFTGIIFNDATFTYNGLAHSIFASNLPAGAVVDYIANGQVDVGVYTVSAEISMNNYKDTVMNAILTIEPAIITDIYFGNLTTIYDGKAHSVLVSNLPADATVVYTNNVQTNVGVYNATAVVSRVGHDDVTLTAVLTIEPASIKGIVFNNYTTIYNGTEKSITVTYLRGGETIEYTGNGKVNVGVYTVTALVKKPNHNDLTLTATLTIEPATMSGVVFSNFTTIYNGTAKSIFVSGLPSGATVNYSGNQQTNVGTYTVTAVIKKANYHDLTLTATLTILPATITGLILNDYTTVYDGTAKSTFVSYERGGEIIEYTGNGQIDVGVYTVTALVKKPNYIDLTLTATLTILPATTTGLVLNDFTTVYDGTAKSIFITYERGSETIEYTGNEQTEVGVYEVKALVKRANHYDLTLSATLTIEPAEFTGVTFNNLTTVFDGTAKSILANGLPSGATVTYTNNKQTNVGTYQVTALIKKANYNDLTLTATLVIEPAIITGMVLNNFTTVYDGTAKSIFVTHLRGGEIIEYVGNARINVGTYDVTAIIKKPNYTDLTLHAKLTITPANLTGITFINSTVAYNGTAHSIFVTDVPSGATISYIGNSKTNVGVYQVSALITKANYNDLTLKATLTIVPAALTGISFNSKTVVYNGVAQSIYVNNLPNGVVASYTGNNQINANVYPITATISNPNYKDTTLAATLKINKALLTIKARELELVYGSDPSTLDFTGAYDIMGFVHTDTEAVFLTQPKVTVHPSITSTTPMGLYVDKALVDGATADNYTITHKAGNVRIIQNAGQHITFDPVPDKIYGDARFTLTARHGLSKKIVFGSNNPSVVSVTPEGSAVIHKVGTVTIYAEFAGDADADYERLEQSVVVGKAALLIQPEDKTRKYGENNPTLTVAFTGLKYNDSESDFVSITVSTDALPESPVGKYPITALDAINQNYNISYKPGVLTITKAALTVTLMPETVVYTGNRLTITPAQVAGVVGSVDIPVTYTYMLNKKMSTNAVDAGVYIVTASTVGDANHLAAISEPVLFVVDKANPVINVKDKTAVYTGLPVALDNPIISGTATAIQLGYTLVYKGINGTNYPESAQPPVNVGEYEATVNTAGDKNHNSAMVTATVTIFGTSSFLEGIIINGEPHDITAVYDAGCDTDELDVEILVEPGAVVSVGTNFKVDVRRPAIINIPFTVTSKDGLQSKNYVLMIEKKFNFDDIVEQKWNNVFAINLKKLREDGFSFVAYRWYKNSTVIGTDTYYSAGDNRTDVLDISASYWLELITADGTILRTCYKTPVLTKAEFKAYPNPVVSGGLVTIQANIDEQYLVGSFIEVYSSVGQKVTVTKSTGTSTQIQAPMSSGVYIIRLVGKNGLNESLKIVVE